MREKMKLLYPGLKKCDSTRRGVKGSVKAIK